MATKKKRKPAKKNNKANRIFYLNLSVLVLLLLSQIIVIFKSRMGIIGTFVAKGFFIAFGLTAYVMPLLIIYYYFAIFKKKINKSNIKKNLSVIFIWINILILLGLYFENSELLSQRINSSIRLASENYTGAGYLGVVLHFAIQKLIGNIGIYILTILNLFFAYLAFFNVTMSQVVYQTSNKVNIAKENYKEKQYLKKEKKYLPVQDEFVDKKRVRKNKPSNFTTDDDSNNDVFNKSNPVIRHHVSSGQNDLEIESEKTDNTSKKEEKDAFYDEGDGQLQITPEYEAMNYEFPPIVLLSKPNRNFKSDSDEVLTKNGQIIIETLKSFGIDAQIAGINSGPTVTSYEVKPPAGIKVSKIVNLSNDLSLSLATSGIRIEAPIPGKPYVGIEVPNMNKDMVSLRDLFINGDFDKEDNDLTVALGKNLFGKPIYAKINEMPHVLIAGATGAGKSVCINTIIMSLIYKYSPDDVEFIMIDPKMVELNIYNGIPHLKNRKVVTNAARATNALNFAVREMVDRYEKFSKAKCRDIGSYNEIVLRRGEKKMPYLVVVIDELSDLMMESSKEVENHITRLAQMGRAAGVHLIIATQRPSVDVITGVIKANVPSRISFQVSSQIDSRTILDMSGAEKLLGKGDMLYYPAKFPKPMRVQGAFVSDKEVERVVTYIKNQNIEIEVTDDFNEAIKVENNKSDDNVDDRDEILDEAIEFVITEDQASISAIQRRFRVGYSRAGRIIDQMESLGIVGKHEGSKPRKILVDKSYLTGENDLQEEELIDEGYEDELS